MLSPAQHTSASHRHVAVQQEDTVISSLAFRPKKPGRLNVAASVIANAVTVPFRKAINGAITGVKQANENALHAQAALEVDDEHSGVANNTRWLRVLRPAEIQSKMIAIANDPNRQAPKAPLSAGVNAVVGFVGNGLGGVVSNSIFKPIQSAAKGLANTTPFRERWNDAKLVKKKFFESMSFRTRDNDAYLNILNKIGKGEDIAGEENLAKFKDKLTQKKGGNESLLTRAAVRLCYDNPSPNEILQAREFIAQTIGLDIEELNRMEQNIGLDIEELNSNEQDNVVSDPNRIQQAISASLSPELRDVFSEILDNLGEGMTGEELGSEAGLAELKILLTERESGGETVLTVAAKRLCHETDPSQEDIKQAKNFIAETLGFDIEELDRMEQGDGKRVKEIIYDLMSNDERNIHSHVLENLSLGMIGEKLDNEVGIASFLSKLTQPLDGGKSLLTCAAERLHCEEAGIRNPTPGEMRQAKNYIVNVLGFDFNELDNMEVNPPHRRKEKVKITGIENVQISDR